MATTMWCYKGEDGKEYGPHSSEEMLEWFRAGYFDMNMLLRRETDSNFLPLNHWIQQCRQVPFLSSVNRVDSPFVQQMNAINASLNRQVVEQNGESGGHEVIAYGGVGHPQMVLVPQMGPMLSAHHPVPMMPPGFSGFPLGTPIAVTSHPNSMVPTAPASEIGVDDGASTNSQTPDSDAWHISELRRPSVNERVGLVEKGVDTKDAPWLNIYRPDAVVQCEPDTVSAGVQTETLNVRPFSQSPFTVTDTLALGEAAEKLSELFGIRVNIV